MILAFGFGFVGLVELCFLDLLIGFMSGLNAVRGFGHAWFGCIVLAILFNVVNFTSLTLFTALFHASSFS
jgi:hypothetical protein